MQEGHYFHLLAEDACKSLAWSVRKDLPLIPFRGNFKRGGGGGGPAAISSKRTYLGEGVWTPWTLPPPPPPPPGSVPAFHPSSEARSCRFLGKKVARSKCKNLYRVISSDSVVVCRICSLYAHFYIKLHSHYSCIGGCFLFMAPFASFNLDLGGLK